MVGTVFGMRRIHIVALSALLAWASTAGAQSVQPPVSGAPIARPTTLEELNRDLQSEHIPTRAFAARELKRRARLWRLGAQRGGARGIESRILLADLRAVAGTALVECAARDEVPQKSCILAVGRMGGSAARTTLTSLQEHPDKSVRTRVQRGLEWLGAAP